MPDDERAPGRPLGSRNDERSPELPPRPFLYTLDQVAGLLSIDVLYFKQVYVYFEGRSVGIHGPDFMLARNLAPRGRPTDWRITEAELGRFFKRKGYRLHQRGWVV